MLELSLALVLNDGARVLPSPPGRSSSTVPGLAADESSS